MGPCNTKTKSHTWFVLRIHFLRKYWCARRCQCWKRADIRDIILPVTLSKSMLNFTYGHPDFINSIFMFSRGGISKAQKACTWMRIFMLGWMHSRQRRDRKTLWLLSVWKRKRFGICYDPQFQHENRSWNGEQTLSRECFTWVQDSMLTDFVILLCSCWLPLEQCLYHSFSKSFSYVILVFLGSLEGYESILCITETASSTVEANFPYGCRNLVPVLEWDEQICSFYVHLFHYFFPSHHRQEITEKVC